MNVEVSVMTPNGAQVRVVLPNLQMGSGVATRLTAKGYGVFMQKTGDAITHRNTASAQSYLEVGQMELVV